MKHKIDCPSCDNSYENIGQHWARSSKCSHPELTQREKDLIAGLLMGDGCIDASSKNPRFIIQMTTEPFLEWLDDELGILSTGVTLAQTAEEVAENAKRYDFYEEATIKNCNDQYRLSTRCHPWLKNLNDWYSTGRKRFPEGLNLSPLMFKMWYVSDGHLDRNDFCRPRVYIRANNEEDRPELVEDIFDRSGFDISTYGEGNFGMSCDETERFLEYIGEPVPGFEYKWPNRNV